MNMWTRELKIETTVNLYRGLYMATVTTNDMYKFTVDYTFIM